MLRLLTLDGFAMASLPVQLVIIFNLEDELAFRLSLYIHGLYRDDDAFTRKIITVVDDPDIERLLNHRRPHQNIIHLVNLTAKYVTQLTFQKNLEKVYVNLTTRDATQIQLLDVDVHIPRAALTSKREIKRLLLRTACFTSARSTRRRKVALMPSILPMRSKSWSFARDRRPEFLDRPLCAQNGRPAQSWACVKDSCRRPWPAVGQPKCRLPPVVHRC